MPVTQNGRLTGMVTDCDIATRVVAVGKSPQSKPVHEVASMDLAKDGQLVAVVAQADVARQGNDKQTGQVVRQIPE